MTGVKRLLTIIDSDMDKIGITKGDVAKRLGVSGGTVSNYFKGKHKISYLTFIQLTKVVYGKYNHELIRKFAERTKAKVDIEAMEWAYANSDVKLLAILIDKDKEKRNAITSVYELQLQRIEGEIDPDTFSEKIGDLEFHTKSIDLETQILLGICKIYHHVDSAAFPAVQPVARTLLKQIQRIENEYIKNAFTIRLKIALALSSIRSNNLHKAEEIANEIATQEVYDSFPIYYTNALIYLSEIHFFNDFSRSSQYIKEAMEMVDKGLVDENKRIKKSIKATYDFIHLYHNKFDNLYLEDLAEQAHYYAKQNNQIAKEKALDILEKLFVKQGKLSNFQMYYKSLALNDIGLMEQTKEHFYLSGDFHYVKLPKNFIENFNKLGSKSC
ncbi:AimR family lysis-lysogeny pheromone receptor [Priestia aryabhattai]|uniref:AimR family lysis-lysogeny pheromone receptor n=1 Tax=Priestia aryabhattai TaxID=412384 RepID=UPI00398F7847